MKPPFGRRTGDTSQDEDSAGKTTVEKWLGQEPQVQRSHAPAEWSPALLYINICQLRLVARHLGSSEIASFCIGYALA
jgi:hypothetical protein